MRVATIRRETNETQVELELTLDGRGAAQVQTGLPFLDHMLTHVAVHGLFDLSLRAEGDLQVDAHHTVEDCALALGMALDQSLGDRRGIGRMGAAHVPMDEALAFVVVDLSGRPYCVTEVAWTGPTLGGIATSLFPHFLESLAVTARANIHARVLYGRDDHHKAEALFKALGRALDQATGEDPRRKGEVPSTKGVL
ncbi:MAG: imidazoleglycerol-phosphate dehydratase HisB [Candidatus Promineifilaceae bacterium]|nr:imidazoleglycerol-phosphate dehydratase HisB [Candidatus Promineifilaceae bacterium]